MLINYNTFEDFDPHNISCPDGIIERMLMSLSIFCVEPPAINKIKNEIQEWIQELNLELDSNPYMSELEGAAKQAEKEIRDQIWTELVSRKLDGKSEEEIKLYRNVLFDVSFITSYLQPIQYQGKKQRKRHSHKGRKHKNTRKNKGRKHSHKKGVRKHSHKGRKHSHKKGARKHSHKKGARKHSYKR